MKRYRLKSEVKYALIIIALVMLLIGLIQLLNNDMENHIERVSKECAEKGYGIRSYHTNDGDKFYTCDMGDVNE